MKKQKKILKIASTLAVSLMMLTACGGGSSSEEAETLVDADGREIIKLASPSHYSLPDESIAEFEKMYPKYKVKQTSVMAGAEQYTKFSMMLQSSKTAPDVMAEDGFMLKSDASAGKLYSLDENFETYADKDQFLPSVLEGAKGADGELYGIPRSTDVQLLWYNQEILTEAGVAVPFQPNNWDEIIEAGIKIKELNNGVIPMYMPVNKSSYEDVSMRTFQQLYMGTGGDLYDVEDKKWIIDKTNLLKVATFVNDVHNVHKLVAPIDILATKTVDDIIMGDYIPNEKIGIVFNGSWYMNKWEKGGSFEWPRVEELIGTAKLPTSEGQAPNYTTMSGGWTWAIPALANNKEGAWELLKFMSSKEIMLETVLGLGEVGIRQDVIDNEYHNEREGKLGNTAPELLENTHFRPTYSKYLSVTMLYADFVADIVFGDNTPEQAVTQFEKDLIRAVGKDGVKIID